MISSKAIVRRFVNGDVVNLSFYKAKIMGPYSLNLSDFIGNSGGTFVFIKKFIELLYENLIWSQIGASIAYDDVQRAYL